VFCEVYLFDAPYHIDRPFDYSCNDDVNRGDLVKVPFGRANKLRLGVVYSVKRETDSDMVKPVHSVVSDRFSFTEEMLGLCSFLKEHTLCTFGEAAKTLLPPGALSENLNIKYDKTCVLNISKQEADALLLKTGRGGIKSEGQREIISYLKEIADADYELVRTLPSVNPSHIRALVQRGILRIEATEAVRNPYASYENERDTSAIMLSRAQMQAYNTVESLYTDKAPRAALLYGVTGSGKTKVIMKAIDRVVADKKSVIMLVPEIALTPQTVGIFCKRYGNRVAVIHSALSQGERLDAWRRIRRGEVDLVIGTRSAVFAPLENLGMIVIDEEHEHTYKSESDPKYHAREVASYRAGFNKCLMLLASATPSLESFYKAKEGRYTLIPLRERYGGVTLPDAVIVDMREEIRLGNTTPISDRLLNALNEVSANGEQAILFLNRRGYNSQISCKNCGEVITCPRCSVSLTYHTGGGGKLLCHLCGYTAPTPRVCPSCDSDNISFLGFGTQKVEGALSEYIPNMRVMRMDADTTSGKLAYDKMLDDFRNQGADILLGTQMVAKGHDFPSVTLVGVVLADTSLYHSDFRANERTFSLLTQVIGRAGRARSGGVAVIQTYSPTNEIIKLACEQDYDKFYEGEIAIRRELGYPPFCDMVALTVTGEDEMEVIRSSQQLCEQIKEMMGGEYKDIPLMLFGPFEAQVYKFNDKYRMRMVAKCRLNSRARGLFHKLLVSFGQNKKVNLAVDLNPLTV